VEEIEKRTGGKVTFEKYWNSALLGGREQLDGLSHGVTDVALIPPGFWPGRLPVGYSNYAFPFKPRSLALCGLVWSQMYQEFPWMHNELTEQNIKLLHIGGVSDYGILSRMPLKKLEDFKGKKIVQFGSYFADWTAVTGLTPVSGILPGERYERMRTGVVDGSLLTPSLFKDMKEYEVAKYLIMLGVGAAPSQLVGMNLKKWNELTPELQKLFMEVAQETQKRYQKAVDEAMEKDLKFLQAKGVTYYGYLSDEEIKKWSSIIPDTPAMMCKSLEGKYPKIWDMAHRFIELCEKYGHKWPRNFAVK